MPGCSSLARAFTSRMTFSRANSLQSQTQHYSQTYTHLFSQIDVLYGALMFVLIDTCLVDGSSWWRSCSHPLCYVPQTRHQIRHVPNTALARSLSSTWYTQTQISYENIPLNFVLLIWITTVCWSIVQLCVGVQQSVQRSLLKRLHTV